MDDAAKSIRIGGGDLRAEIAPSRRQRPAARTNRARRSDPDPAGSRRRSGEATRPGHVCYAALVQSHFGSRPALCRAHLSAASARPGPAPSIHGLGLHRAWDVLDAGPSTCALRLVDRSCPPFAYEAVLRYRVDEDGFSAALEVVHLGDDPAPYGIGFHPWMARDPDDRLAFLAVAYVAEDENRLPIGIVRVADAPERDFSSAHPLPLDVINGTYLGWNGRATLERGLGMTVTVGGRGDISEHLHLFSRSGTCGFVCLEPTSHTVDSENRPMGPSSRLRVLRRGEVISGEVSIAVADCSS